MTIKALICGGGNGAHVMAGIAASQPGIEAYVCTLFADEAERWTNAMKDNDFTVTCYANGKDPVLLKNKPKQVVKDPQVVASDCDIVIFAVPAFAHRGYLEALKPYVKPGTVLAGLPGQAGFEFAVVGVWGDLARQCTIMSFESLPWACRMLEFGKSAEVLGTKASMQGAVQMGKIAPKMDPTQMLQQTLGAQPKLITQGHLLGITLMATNGYIHPSISYGKWCNWDGTPCDEAPLFYNGLDEFSANMLSGASDEVVATAKAIMAARPQVDLSTVIHIYEWYLRCYGDQVGDKTNLHTTVRTNNAYTGLKHPMKPAASEGKLVPDFGYRYMTEDIPFGMVVMRGVASIAGVETPNMDKIITWAQKQMDKEYLVGGALTGKDIGSTRCAQAYGITDLDTMLGL